MSVQPGSLSPSLPVSVPPPGLCEALLRVSGNQAVEVLAVPGDEGVRVNIRWR